MTSTLYITPTKISGLTNQFNISDLIRAVAVFFLIPLRMAGSEIGLAWAGERVARNPFSLIYILYCQ